ncbi:MAG: hypothetical protein LRZ84_06920 [Desertifilum sp.]|nr:hypothetical protein [Desertifilum sp.]
MASETQVKQYLAYWFQLGKKVIVSHTNQALLPRPIFQGNSYSEAFEQCWQTITSPQSGDCFLDGTNETITELLKPEWELVVCSRCTLPIPSRMVGMPPESCPCSDLPSWPNHEVPLPRSAVDNQTQLSQIRDRLVFRLKTGQAEEETQPACPIGEIPLCGCPEAAVSDDANDSLPKEHRPTKPAQGYPNWNRVR